MLESTCLHPILILQYLMILYVFLFIFHISMIYFRDIA